MTGILHILGAAAALAAATPQRPASPPPVATVARDEQARLTMAVFINGAGPFRFLVDTAATRSVVSQALAARLALADAGTVSLQDLDTHGAAPAVRIDQLRIGARTVDGLTAVVLRAEDVGADGILGLDSFEGQRLSIDAKRSRITSTAADLPPASPPGASVREMAADPHHAQMFITDADVNGWPVTLVIDSGASVSVLNPRARRLLRSRSHTTGAGLGLLSVTGRATPVEAVKLDRLRVGQFVIANAPADVADLGVFRQLVVADRPAMLLGADLLRMFDRVDLDFSRRRVSFVVHQDARQMMSEAQWLAQQGPRMGQPTIARPPVYTAPPPRAPAPAPAHP